MNQSKTSGRVKHMGDHKGEHISQTSESMYSIDVQGDTFLKFEKSGEAKNRFGDPDQYKAMYKRRITLAPNPFDKPKGKTREES